MIYFIAPYSKQFLGASRKIELLLGILAQIDEDVVLINSFGDTTDNYIRINSGGVPIKIRQYHLPNDGESRFSSSLENYINADKILKDIVEQFGLPNFIWLYNGYFLESILACKLKKKYNPYFFFEFEDWHFSRSRGLNPKPVLDYVAWRFMMKKIDCGFAVNSSLAQKIRNFGKPTYLLPGLISNELIKVSNKVENKPFSNRINQVKLGYFGGITEEKGAKLILDLFEILPDNYEFIITGTGEMEKDFSSISKRFPKRFKYYGRVDDNKLISLISEVDVFLNPHQPVASMGDGVFPFKVMEAIASKRLIFSTPLTGNSEFAETLTGISFIDYSLDVWVSSLLDAKEIYKQKEVTIGIAAQKAHEKFSEHAIKQNIFNIYQSIISY